MRSSSSIASISQVTSLLFGLTLWTLRICRQRWSDRRNVLSHTLQPYGRSLVWPRIWTRRCHVVEKSLPQIEHAGRSPELVLVDGVVVPLVATRLLLALVNASRAPVNETTRGITVPLVVVLSPWSCIVIKFPTGITKRVRDAHETFKRRYVNSIFQSYCQIDHNGLMLQKW